MSNRKYKFVRILSIVPVILWMCVIFSFSACEADQSDDMSLSVGKWIGERFVPGFDEWSQDRQEAFAEGIDYPVRKCAHASEYAVLGVFWMLALSVNTGRRSGRMNNLDIDTVDIDSADINSTGIKESDIKDSDINIEENAAGGVYRPGQVKDKNGKIMQADLRTENSKVADHYDGQYIRAGSHVVNSGNVLMKCFLKLGMWRSAWLLCTLYACTDEFHQLFVAGRSCQLKDVMIDSGGALAGICFCLLAGMAVRYLNYNVRRKF